MKVKLLNADLIRTFGGVFVDMNDSQAAKYIHKGLAVEAPNKSTDSSFRRKSVDVPPEDKSVWYPPEKKIFDPNANKASNEPYPGVNDKLFSQID